MIDSDLIELALAELRLQQIKTARLVNLLETALVTIAPTAAKKPVGPKLPAFRQGTAKAIVERFLGGLSAGNTFTLGCVKASMNGVRASDNSLRFYLAVAVEKGTVSIVKQGGSARDPKVYRKEGIAVKLTA
jgi:hypothetical protein